MKILHTADWHLGKRLYRQKRENEHTAFLDWLLVTIEQEEIDVVIVAGDIFDTATPAISAQQQYYRFLFRLGQSRCRHSIIIAGNHDNPAFLDAPRALLQAFNIHVIGAVLPADKETFVLHDANGTPELIVSAVPYLHERDLRRLEPGETPAAKAEKTIQAIHEHYHRAGRQVKQLRACYGDLPALATGHLFAAGATTTGDDGVRELYVGTLSRIGADVFPKEYDYVALGHIHIPQIVAGCAHIRYSGSPLALGFGEAGQQKQVMLLKSAGRCFQLTPLMIPCFQAMARYRGNRHYLIQMVKQHVAHRDNIWLELDYTDKITDAELSTDLQALCHRSDVKILSVRNSGQQKITAQMPAEIENPAAFTPEAMFIRRLAEENISAECRADLLAAYTEILHTLPDE